MKKKLLLSLIVGGLVVGLTTTNIIKANEIDIEPTDEVVEENQIENQKEISENEETENEESLIEDSTGETEKEVTNSKISRSEGMVTPLSSIETTITSWSDLVTAMNTAVANPTNAYVLTLANDISVDSTITMTNGNVTIDGAGYTLLPGVVGNTGRAFDVNTGAGENRQASLTLKNLTMSHAIRNGVSNMRDSSSTSLYLSNVTIDGFDGTVNNMPVIYTYAKTEGSNMEMTNCTFTNNNYSGMLFTFLNLSTSTLLIDNCVFDSNESSASGIINIQTNGHVIFKNSEVKNNTSVSGVVTINGSGTSFNLDSVVFSNNNSTNNQAIRITNGSSGTITGDVEGGVYFTTSNIESDVTINGNIDGELIMGVGNAKIDGDATVGGLKHITGEDGKHYLEVGNGVYYTAGEDGSLGNDDDYYIYCGDDGLVGTADDIVISSCTDDLFNSEGNIVDSLTQEDIDYVEDIVNRLPDGDLKEELLDKIMDAQNQFNEREAEKSVNDLFNPDGTIKNNVTQEDINDAQDLVNKVTDEDKKKELQDKLDDAQNQLNEREAEKAVDDLFNPDGTIKDNVKQEDIDDAQDLVNKVTDEDKKKELQDKLDDAQKQLDEKEAENVVDDLFNPDGTIKEDLTQEDIDNAEDLVNQLPAGDVKDELKDKLEEAQKQYDEKHFVVLEGFKVFTGTGSVYTKIDAPVEKFSKVYVDGKLLPSSNYVVTSGSTVVTINEAYLKTLANGTYDVEIEFASGAKVATPLTVNVKGNPSVAPSTSTPSTTPTVSGGNTSTTDNVNTGDSTGLIQLYMLLGVSILVFAVVVKRKKV
ncbi:right-handed parallel beta-helix repeat-containing protein [Breznakia pachnodae]|uniref:Pesticidal crystal protein Cry1Aa domain-containing protein n=1 Tax=Breznakia pachnodae TaxID=265178 RepID=A0ABU0E0Q6_9FIRM|nr:right-handed parallel beta-helix repeat-containing protein [Breznakia pachnodae]MDQ0360390.1 hypothetical protein [Breznakia pachnodae]